MKRFRYIMAFVGMLVLGLGACSDDDNYTPGMMPAEDCMGVYFGADDNPNDLLVYAPGDRYAIDLNVYRRKVDKAASVPVTLESNDTVFKVPSTVNFEEGKEMATLTVTFPNLKAQKLSSFTIKIDDAYTDPYVQVPGLSFCNCTVIETQLVTIAKNVEFKFDDKDRTPTSVYADFYQYEGINRYRIDNFLNSGINLVFSVGKRLNSGRYNILPLANFYMNDEEHGDWYFCDDNGDDVLLNLPDAKNAISSVYFFGQSSSTSYYTYVNFDKKEGRFYLYAYYDDETDGYNPITFSW